MAKGKPNTSLVKTIIVVVQSEVNNTIIIRENKMTRTFCPLNSIQPANTLDLYSDQVIMIVLYHKITKKCHVIKSSIIKKK